MNSYAQLITAKYVVTINANFEIFSPGAIYIVGDSIVDVGTSDVLKAKYPKASLLDYPNEILLPGLVNTHTHIAMSLLRGIADDMPLKEWLETVIWPLEKEFVNKDFVTVGSFITLAEFIRGGITCFNDMYFFQNEIAEATATAGLRAVMGETLIDFPTPNAKTPNEGITYSKQFVARWKNHPLISPCIVTHAPYSCSATLLQSASNLSKELEIPLSIHISETKTEIQESQEKYGLSPVEYLDSLQFLNNSVIAAHCVHLSENDISILYNRGVGIAHNPGSNLKLASGIAPLTVLLQKGITVGLGTDGSASNNNLSLFEEMTFASLLQKVVTGSAETISAKEMVYLATQGGANVLKLGTKIGSLEKGKKADFILISIQKPHAQPMYNVYSHIVYSAVAADVVSTYVNGKCLYDNGEIKTFNENQCYQKAVEMSQKIITFRLK